MNEHLNERFVNSRRRLRRPGDDDDALPILTRLNQKVAEYYEPPRTTVRGGSWLHQHEVPSSNEILDVDTGSSSSSSNVELPVNRIRGAWETKEEYLSAHYELLREDAVRPLREAVQQVRITPQAKEEAFRGSIGIYEKVHICSVKCCPRGVAIRVTFSLFRAGKKILWEQSKRLVTGSLVVLSPAQDQFKTKAIIATIAARPLDGLRCNPPEIDLFIARPEEQEIDPAQEFWMVEHRGSMYEADRHTLVALQRMMREPFPLQEHLLAVQTNVLPPHYVLANSRVDLSTALVNGHKANYDNVKTLKDWPAEPHSNLDASQLAALRSILSKRLAIIQGPPGTGKTFISVEAIKIMLANRTDDDPPIIIACQTNHAIDQLLNHIAQFETKFVRLGGRSKDKGIVRARTLYEVRYDYVQAPLAGSLGPRGRREMKDLAEKFKLLLIPLKDDNRPLDHGMLLQLGLLTQTQVDTLESGASQWVQSTLTHVSDATRSPFFVWLGDKLKAVPPKQQSEDFGFEYEEADLEFEQLKDMEAENQNKDDEDFEDLRGESLPIADNFTCAKQHGMACAKLVQQAEDALAQQDMWKIPEAVRPAVYRYLQSEMKTLLRSAFRELTKSYNDAAEKRRIGRFQEDERILRQQKVIGMTTTGLSKYRGLLASLQPRIVLIEEAAEVLEAPVSVACLPSVQHLILVGDHKQLRPHCKVRDHEGKPFYLNVSLFERLVNNGIEYNTLSRQRRMIPEIRRILYPIYGNIIKDHKSVSDVAQRPPIPGMGGVNSFFFTHQWHEQRDDQSSAYNNGELEMIVGFVKYLIYNGTTTDKITILTFYNGQRKKLLTQLRGHPELPGQLCNVVTVDSYQGEENDIIILSLVRSNEQRRIGFLDIDNRVCVALSRAKRGFYIFGNGSLLYNFPTWKDVINIMANRGKNRIDYLQSEPKNRLNDALPVRCQNHGQLTEIRDSIDWDKIKGGGCEQQCGEKLECGHRCPLTCHPFQHDMVVCQQLCGQSLPCCKRPCKGKCGESCVCMNCKRNLVNNEDFEDDGDDGDGCDAHDGDGALLPQSPASSWQGFATEEPAWYAEAVAAYNSSRQMSPKNNNTDVGTSIAASHRVRKADDSRSHARSNRSRILSTPVSSVADKLGSTSDASFLVDVSNLNQLSLSEDAGPVTSQFRGGSGVSSSTVSRRRWITNSSDGASGANEANMEDWSKEGSLLD